MLARFGFCRNHQFALLELPADGMPSTRCLQFAERRPARTEFLCRFVASSSRMVPSISPETSVSGKLGHETWTQTASILTVASESACLGSRRLEQVWCSLLWPCPRSERAVSLCRAHNEAQQSMFYDVVHVVSVFSADPQDSPRRN